MFKMSLTNTSVDKVRTFLQQHCVRTKIIELSGSTRTAIEAAQRLKVPLDQIAKSLVFAVDEKPILAIVPGNHKVDETKLARIFNGNTAYKVDADTAREVTGFPVGGIPPFAHHADLRIVIDQSLFRNEVIYVAAGNPRSMLAIDPNVLRRLSQARIADTIVE